MKIVPNYFGSQSGHRFSKGVPAEVPDEIGAAMIKAGTAEKFTEEKPKEAAKPKKTKTKAAE